MVAGIDSSLPRRPLTQEQWPGLRLPRPARAVGGSTHALWWQCPVAPSHEWQATPHDRIDGRGACPFCLGMRVSEKASLAATAAAPAAEWHPIKNGRLTPRDVLPTTTRVVWWQCRRVPTHEWRTSVL